MVLTMTLSQRLRRATTSRRSKPHQTTWCFKGRWNLEQKAKPKEKRTQLVCVGQKNRLDPDNELRPLYDLQLYCARPVQDSATTLVALPQAWKPFSLDCFPRSAIIAWHCSTLGSCSSLQQHSLGCYLSRRMKRMAKILQT